MMKLRMIWVAVSVAIAGCAGGNSDDFDGDGSADSVNCAPDDPTIHLAAVENCSDGIDNDCDSWLDCADADCLGMRPLRGAQSQD